MPAPWSDYIKGITINIVEGKPEFKLVEESVEDGEYTATINGRIQGARNARQLRRQVLALLTKALG